MLIPYMQLLNSKTIVLASASQRRQEILDKLVLLFPLLIKHAHLCALMYFLLSAVAASRLGSLQKSVLLTST